MWLPVLFGLSGGGAVLVGRRGRLGLAVVWVVGPVVLGCIVRFAWIEW